jgi:formylglycine-generating enzyme required for sulfatase activity
MNTLADMLAAPAAKTALRFAAVILIATGLTLLFTAPRQPAPAETAQLAAAVVPVPVLPPSIPESSPLPVSAAGHTPPSLPVEVTATPPRSESRPVAIRARGGDDILHYYQDSQALLVGSPATAPELEAVGRVLDDRGFQVETLVDPDLATLNQKIASLSKRSDGAPPPDSRRVLLYLSGETVRAEGRDEVFFRAADTPAGIQSAARLRATAYPIDDLRYLASDLAGSALLIVANSGFRALFLEESGEQPSFLEREGFASPRPYFIISGSQGGQPDPGFAERFQNAFKGDADSDADHHVSALELSRYLGKPAYLATISGQRTGDGSNPGMVFHLPENAIVKPLADNHRSIEKKPADPQSAPVSIADVSAAGPPPATPSSAVRAVPGAPIPGEMSAAAAAPLGAAEVPAFGSPFALESTISLQWLPPGEFTLIRAAGGAAPEASTPPPTQKMAGFWMSADEITVAQYDSILGSPSGTGESANNPKRNVTWVEATAFCEQLTQSERAKNRLPAGHIYRLPHEVEWEYAAAPGPRRFRQVNLLPVAAWAAQLAVPAAASAGLPESAAPQSIRAMTTGVKEWCCDDFVSDPADSRAPQPPPGAKVVRGGLLDTDLVRLSTRFGIYSETDRLPHLGFRVVLAPEAIDLPAGVTAGAPAMAIGGEVKPFSRDELFAESPYAAWDSHNKTLILRKAQSAFKELGFYQASVDGDAGPSTQAALNRFQAERRLTVTGKLDAPTLAALSLGNETKKQAPPSGPWWVTRPNSPRAGDPEPPGSAYHGPVGRLKLLRDKDKGTLDQKEYRKFQNYARWEDVQP